MILLLLLLGEVLVLAVLGLLLLSGFRRRLTASRFDLSLLKITDADISRYWYLALISSLLPAREGPTWFASHVGYLYDLDGSEKRRHLLSLVTTFPRQLVVSWRFDADAREVRRSLTPRRLAGRLSYRGLLYAETVLDSIGTVLFFALRTNRGQALRLWCCRCVVEERHGHVVRRRTVRLRDLPNHREFVAEILRPDRDVARQFLQGKAVLTYPSAQSSPPQRRTHRFVTVHVNGRSSARKPDRSAFERAS